MSYNLTKKQKEVLQWIVSQVRKGSMNEEFGVAWTLAGCLLCDFQGNENDIPEISKGDLDVLAEEDLLHCDIKQKITKNGSLREDSRRCVLKAKAYEAVDQNFSAADTSFVKFLTPLEDIEGFDEEIKRRCLPILGAGSNDPTSWDSAVRVCGVILEERLREVGEIKDTKQVGQNLVNVIFGEKGTLSNKFENNSQRQAYRDLYAGILGCFRNPSAHNFIDPPPEEGGAFIVFVNHLLKRLEQLR